jgi:predicted transcriptional regulator
MPAERRQIAWVLSLRTHHARRIYAGLKHWEFRRVRASIPVGATVYIYESGRVGRVTGSFVVGETVTDTPIEVLGLEPDVQSRMDAREYLDGASVATALKVTDVCPYPRPRSLA